MNSPLLIKTASGTYCPAADIYIDPHRAVEKAIITHAHSDHAYRGHKSYLSHEDSGPLLKLRLGNINLQTLKYGEVININGVSISLHPAGHIFGSAQVRISAGGEIWVVSGDYKLENDGISTPFEPIRCDYFITESTFSLPIFHWPAIEQVQNEINQWWRNNQQNGKTSVLMGYSLGKVQRLLNLLDPSIGPIYLHDVVYKSNEAIASRGVSLNPAERFDPIIHSKNVKQAMIISPPSTKWLQQFIPYSAGYASGWMTLAKMRKAMSADEGFIISDHVDWEGVNTAVKQTGAHTILPTHGYTAQLSRHLTEQGLQSRTW